MLSEEKKAIGKLDRLTAYGSQKGNIGIPVMIKDLKTVLNLITKLQKENEEKDKQIDLMVKMIDELSEYYTRYWGKNNEFCKEECVKKDIDCKDCIKKYFEKLAKEKDI